MYIDIDVSHPEMKCEEVSGMRNQLDHLLDIAPSDSSIKVEVQKDEHFFSATVQIKSQEGFFSAKAKASSVADLTSQLMASLEAQIHTWKDLRFNQEEIRRPSQTAHFKKLRRCLVVDDDEDMTRLLAKQLKKEHCRVETSADGFEALDKLSNSNYDLILIDWDLPGMSAGEMLRQTDQYIDKDPLLSEKWGFEKKPVIILSGHEVSKLHFPEVNNFEIVDFWQKREGPKALINKVKNRAQQNFYVA